MNSVLVILITGMAVLGAYYLAELLTEGMEKPKQNEAILILPEPVDPSRVWEIAISVRRQLPRCQVIAVSRDAGELPPCAGIRGLKMVPGSRLEEETLRELHLQTAAQDL